MTKTVFIRGHHAYYKEAKKILEESKIFKVLAKTPSLFLSSQIARPYQKEYYDSLINAIKNREIRIKYLFSLPLTREEIIKIASTSIDQAVRDLNSWLRYSKNEKIKLKYISFKNPFSCVIGDSKTAVLMVYPNGGRGCLVLPNETVPFYNEAFEQLFDMASEEHEKEIQKIKRELTLNNQQTKLKT